MSVQELATELVITATKERREERRALEWARSKAGAEAMATTKRLPGGVARREWRHQLVTHERALERLLRRYPVPRDEPA